MTDPSDADLPAQVRDKALQLLARREHSFAELRQKLLNRQFPLDLIDELLAKLEARGDLSDQRYAEALASYRAKNGYGPAYIRQELREKGVDSTIASTAIESVEVSWKDSAAARYKSHFKSSSIEDYADWSRRAAYLKRRGFDTEVIFQVLGEWTSPG